MAGDEGKSETLKQLRVEIDRVDEQLVELLVGRISGCKSGGRGSNWIPICRDSGLSRR